MDKIIKELKEKVTNSYESYCASVESAYNYEELCDTYGNDIEIIISEAEEKLLFNDKIDHEQYDNSETIFSMYSSLLYYLSANDNQSQNVTRKELEAFIRKIKWQKKISMDMIQNELKMISIFDEVIDIIDENKDEIVDVK